jgi:peptidoglycan/xylan/chitin deacetylase (PgdA/CDA1 family)
MRRLFPRRRDVATDGNRHQVTFLTTFDFDAETIWKQNTSGYRGPAFESQGTFGPKVAIWRILDLLDEFEVKATFCTPGWVAEKHQRAVNAVLERGHEVAQHGYLHERVEEFVAIEEEEMILLRGKEAIEKSTGVTPAGYRPPSYIYTEHTLDLLRQHGYIWGSAMQDDDAAYIHPGPGRPIVEFAPLWHLTDDLYGFHNDVKMSPSIVEENWVTELRELGAWPDRIYVPTMHPQTIGHPGRLAMLRRVLQVGRELGVRFARCGDVAREMIARADGEGQAGRGGEGMS